MAESLDTNAGQNKSFAAAGQYSELGSEGNVDRRIHDKDAAEAAARAGSDLETRIAERKPALDKALSESPQLLNDEQGRRLPTPELTSLAAAQAADRRSADHVESEALKLHEEIKNDQATIDRLQAALNEKKARLDSLGSSQ